MTTTAPQQAAVDREGVRPAVDAVLAAFLADQEPILRGVAPELGDVHAMAVDYLAGGKRLRPAFCYWGWRATGASADDGLIRAAASLELLQACALVHDDVMDASDTRRGKPSAHRQFEAHHAAHGWGGSADAFGLGAAILLGDLFLAWSDDLFSTSGVSPAALVRARPLFATMRTELMAGQYLDLVVQAQPTPSRKTIESVLHHKSAKYTIQHPLQLGALLAGAEGPVVAGLGDYGLALGEAFQLRDDVLGVFGDPAVTGKPAGDDLREGKQTLLVALALEGADASQGDLLRRRLGRPLTPEQVDEVRAVLQETGAVAAVEARIDELTTAARQALARTPIIPDAAEALGALAEAAVRRRK